MIKAFLKRLSPKFQMFTGVYELRKGNVILQSQEYDRIGQKIAAKNPDHLALSGYKVYSQTDEDGIIEKIFSMIPGNKTFVEIGVQSGVECNSLLLLLKGWRGAWIEGSAKYCEVIRNELGGSSFGNHFKVKHSFVTRENIVELLSEAMTFLGSKDLDFFSLDIDGNDLHCLRAILASKVRPKVICVEYNAKFPPGVAVTVRYSPDHVWDESDYMGSSLQALYDVMVPGGYRLVTCNIPGINAFFVREDMASAFQSLDIAEAYQPFRFYLSPIASAQPPSLNYLRETLANLSAASRG